MNNTRICIFLTTDHGPEVLSPDYFEQNALGGSETAALHLARCFRKKAMHVDIVLDWRSLSPESYDIFISLRDWRMFAEGLRPGKLNYLWCHDDIMQPFVSPLKDRNLAERVYNLCDGVVLLSHYQAYQWILNLNVPESKVFMAPNGINLTKFDISPSSLVKRPRHAYYASTPFRGLDNLLTAWPLIYETLGKEARLTICSSRQIYNQPDLATDNEMFAQARALPGVHYLGSVGQAQIRKIASECRALAYPCSFPETSCITAMEAMASGCVVVSTALGALPETAWRNPLMPITEKWLDLWIEELLRVFVDDDYYLHYAESNLHLSHVMGWDRVARKWLMRFRSDCVKQASP